MPALEILHLPNDHTGGARRGLHTPKAFMADNDLALGRIVEAISRSQFWKSTVMFVVEDDAQDGPDHVDSHRSVLLAVSAWNRRGVSHPFVNTTDVLASIEEILGLDALSQFSSTTSAAHCARSGRRIPICRRTWRCRRAATLCGEREKCDQRRHARPEANPGVDRDAAVRVPRGQCLRNACRPERNDDSRLVSPRADAEGERDDEEPKNDRVAKHELISGVSRFTAAMRTRA